MLIYDPYEKYSYEPFINKSRIKEGLTDIYKLINSYGNHDFESHPISSDMVFFTIMDYCTSDKLWNKMVTVKINISVIMRSDYTNSLLKDSASYHKTVKGIKLSHRDTESILCNGIMVGRAMNIRYLQIKLGKIRVRLRY